MTTKDFDRIKDYILAKNKYFTAGFANAFTDTLTEGVYTRVNGDLKSIFPDDRLGNYFYLRNDPSVTFTAKPGYQDCGPGKAIYDDRFTVYLLASVRDADELTLLNSLRNTLVGYKDAVIVPVSAITQRENAVITEMAGFEEETIVSALEDLKKETIIRIQLQVTMEYIPNNCIISPCKYC